MKVMVCQERIKGIKERIGKQRKKMKFMRKKWFASQKYKLVNKKKSEWENIKWRKKQINGGGNEKLKEINEWRNERTRT